MTPKNGHRPMIAYLRQSRAKEKTISIDEQRRAIVSWAKAHDVALAEEVVEQGVSGSKSWRERELGKAIAACEAGTAQGVIVAYQDRLSRENGLATAEVWDALDRAQARLVCAAEGLDTATGDHELTFSIKAAIARDQWKRHRANWENARRNAVERGVQPGPTPTGYRRAEDGRFEVDPKTAPAVVAAFECRASGGSWKKASDVLSAGTGRPWSLKATEKMLKCETYLGHVKSGEFAKADCHEPIVSRVLFHRVQASRATRGQTTPRTPGLVSGLIVCAGCGNKMSQDTTTRRGVRVPFYRCVSVGVCGGPASVTHSRVEPYIADLVIKYFHGMLEATTTAEDRTAEFETAVRLAGLEVEAVDAHRERMDPVSFGMARTDAVRVHDEAVEALENYSPVSASPPRRVLERLYETWKRGEDEGKTELRDLVLRVIEKVEVRRGAGPIEERVRVVWAAELH